MTEHLDAGRLAERLRLSEEWNVRLQNQIQSLLQLPANDVVKLRSKMQSPDIAIPLLQCYDATIQEKQAEIDALQQQNHRLRAAADALNAGHGEANNAVRIAEELLRQTAERAREDSERAQREVEQLQRDLLQMRKVVTELTESESALKRRVELETKKSADAAAQADQLRCEKTALEDALRDLQRKIAAQRGEDDASRHEQETQKIQLHLVSKENDDKMIEIERLRQRMVQALKQAAENHNTHLRIVEEKHKNVICAMREELKGQELMILKLRAQLARAEISPEGGRNCAVALQTTAAVIDSQARQALELELKRLYGEVASAQMQRDDALYRLEQFLISRRSDGEDRIAEMQRNVDLHREQRRAAEERSERVEKQLSVCRDDLRRAREQLKSMAAEVQKVASERDLASRRAEDLQRQMSRHAEALSEARAEKDAAVEGERRGAKMLERRLQQCEEELQQERERVTSLIAEHDRKLHTLQQQLLEQDTRLNDAHTRADEKTRVAEVLQTKVERLQQGLKQFRDQAALHAEQQQRCAQQEQQYKHTIRSMTLLVEQLRMEAFRLEKDRDRALQGGHDVLRKV
jgi:hypothetical protein